MAVIITRRARQHIRGLYFRSNRKNINIRMEVRSLIDAIEELVTNGQIIPSSNRKGILSIWDSQGYSIFEVCDIFTRKSFGNKYNNLLSKKQKARKWYFACVIDSNNLYIVDAVFCKYLDRITAPIPFAMKFISAMKGRVTRQKKQNAKKMQYTIQFPIDECKYKISQIITETIRTFIRRECI